MLAWTTRQLNSNGLRIEQTFDLQVARLSHAGYLCPTHGTSHCDCQMIVILVYGLGSEPLTLILLGVTQLKGGMLNLRHEPAKM